MRTSCWINIIIQVFNMKTIFYQIKIFEKRNVFMVLIQSNDKNSGGQENWRKQNFLLKILTISIQFNKKYNIVENLMQHQNIFLDEETYLKRNHSAQELAELQNKEDGREIARFFTSKECDTNQMREAVSHQIEKVIQNLPSKIKPIFKNKFQRLTKQKKNKNGKFQQSVKYTNACSSKTEADHQLLDFFDHRIQITNKFH